MEHFHFTKCAFLHQIKQNHKLIKWSLFQLDLVNEITTFGRKGDCDISDVIDKSKLCDVSSIHFTIHKNNGANSVSPVFLEVRTTT